MHYHQGDIALNEAKTTLTYYKVCVPPKVNHTKKKTIILQY